MTCEDCGTKLELNGTCPNCHEELFIATWQADDLPYPLSEEFKHAVEEQTEIVRQNRESTNPQRQEER